MATVTLKENDGLIIRIPELGVTVNVDPAGLAALARRAHGNRAQKSQDGPLAVVVSGKLPDVFKDYFTLYTQRGTSQGWQRNLRIEKARELFERAQKNGDATYLAIHDSRKKLVVAEWGHDAHPEAKHG